MRWTKYNGNMPEQHAAELHWRHSSDKSPLHMKQHVVLDKLIVEYEAGRYKYDLNNLEYLDESLPANDMPNAFQNEPVNFLLSNALRHLTQDQQRQLCNALQERLPAPASIEDEAERLYPDTKENETVSMGHNGIQDLRRSAHITCARQYMGEISTLKEVRDNLWKCFETEKNNHIHFANECEKLQAENSKMRKGLEEIQLIVATESREELNITGLLSLATEALK